MALLPFSASAAGLGKLSVISGLGEPLSAEIELLVASADELSSISAALAPDEAYNAQGLEPPALRGVIKVEIGKKPNGTPVLKLTSKQPISDPFLDMLIQVDWSTGRLLREYTVLLDPPGYNADNSAPAPVAKPVVSSHAAEKQPAARTSRGSASMSASEPSSGSRKSGDSITTKPGDSLIGIARKTQVQDISLEQMMVGLFHANKNAFIDDNMNRLKVGEVVRVPAAEELAAVSKNEASQEIHAQTQNWNTYRNKLASSVAEAPAKDTAEAGPSVSGKIVAATVDKSTPPTEGPRDVVKLSKIENTADKAGGNDKKALQEKLNALQEEATAREKSVKEANERVAALEKQIEDMKKLLAVKNQAMADLQKLAGAQNNGAKVAAEPAPPTPAPAASPPATPPAETAAKPEPAASPAPVKTVKKPIVAPPPVAVETSMIDGVPDDLLFGGVGGAVVLLGGAWLFMRNRRRQNLDSFEQGIVTAGGMKTDTVFGNTAENTAESNDTSFLTNFSQSTTDSMIDSHDVDPIAEAEVYMAYGREAQAEEILKDAISKEPKRNELHLKLLELYASQKDTAAFETIAGELYSTLGTSDPTWAKIAEMGRKLEPDNPLYQGTTSQDSGDAAATEAEAAGFENTVELNLDEQASEQSMASMPEEIEQKPKELDSLDFNLGSLETETPAGEAAQESAPEMAMAGNGEDLGLQLELPEQAAEGNAQLDVADFGQTMPGIEMPQIEPASPVEPKPEVATEISFDLPEMVAEPVAPDIQPEPALAEFELPSFESTPPQVDQEPVANEEIVFAAPAETSTADLDLELAASAIEPAAPEIAAPAEIDFSGISLDLDAPAEAQEESVGAVESAAPESSEVETKLDLVTAYIDMGDKEGARELLDEVLKEGGAKQRERAQQLLSGLG